MPFKVDLGNLETFSSSPNHGGQHLRPILLLFPLEKLTNHFLKVKLNPGSILHVDLGLF